ncbi:MAG: thioredoxin [bacterium]
MAILITPENFEQEIMQSALPVVIDVFAPWCGPCQQMGPIFDELAKELSETCKLTKLNIDNNRELAIQYNVSSIPTFIFIKNGKVIAKESGSMNKEMLKAKIAAHLE